MLIDSPEAIMQAFGINNAGPGVEITWSELMLEGKEKFLEKFKGNGTMLGFNFILIKFVKNRPKLNSPQFNTTRIEVRRCSHLEPTTPHYPTTKNFYSTS